MKKYISVVLSLILSILVIIFSVFSTNAVTTAFDENFPNYVFSLEYGADNSTIYGIYQYTGTDSNIIIPEYANGYPIKYIDEKAFYKNTNITNVTLNNNITQIRHWAFRNCENLSTVYCPPSLAVVWEYAFAYNTNFQSLLLRNTSVENFYKCAFMNDTSLKYVSLPPTTKSIAYACFAGTLLETVNIPDETITIERQAFSNMEKLNRIYIPSSVTTIGEAIFDGSPNVVVYCEEGSVAHQYCIDNSVAFELITKSDFPSLKLGDADNSGDVDVKDVTAMQRELVRIDTEFITDNCDTNGDCSFDITDVTYLQEYLADIKDLPY